MSDQERNTGRTDDMDFSALDEELARMAEETPDVPEDFHDNWTSMIRQEAAASSPETTNVKSRTGRGQMRYILSAAAAFVVLIGGVMLARNNGLLQGTTSVPETQMLTANTLTAGETQEETETIYEDAAVPGGQTDASGMNADYLQVPAPEPETAVFSAEAANMAGTGNADRAEAAQDSAPAAPMLMMTASPTEPAGRKTAAETAERSAEKPGPADIAGAEAETGEAEEAMPEEQAEEPVQEKTEGGRKRDLRSFLQNIWEAILNMIPWILGSAILVLLVLTYVVRPEKKR